MSAILSADDLNDFISPGVACIKPVETLPLQKPEDRSNPYEVTTEDALPVERQPPAQISLTDCLACSGCVTSAEAVLVSLQSHSEVLHALDSSPAIDFKHVEPNDKIFVASVSPQVRASLAATYGVSEPEAGCMIDHLLSGPSGLTSGGTHGNGFTWVVDTNMMREACLVLGTDEVTSSLSSSSSNNVIPKKPILTSACPGWICYAEKTHPHVLSHLSRLKSPQALTGTLLKTVLSHRLNVRPDQIWHLAVMPCFDKKLEASREELTDIYWRSGDSRPGQGPPVRDVDCVITAREVLMLADTRGISFPHLPRTPLPPSSFPIFPDPICDTHLFPNRRHPRKRRGLNQDSSAGTSGGYLYHILQSQLAANPDSALHTTRGRNADVIEYSITRPLVSQPSQPTPKYTSGTSEEEIFKAARYYGFRNIQNLVRKLKPPRTRRLPGAATRPASGGNDKSMATSKQAKTGAINEYAYVEVMACPGGCTNGGGQIKIDDIGIGATGQQADGRMSQKEWLDKVDEAYYSMSDDSDTNNSSASEEDGDVSMQDGGEEDGETINGIDVRHVRDMLRHWSESTGIELRKLCYTTFREVESDVGQNSGGGGQDRVVELAGKIGGGW